MEINKTDPGNNQKPFFMDNQEMTPAEIAAWKQVFAPPVPQPFINRLQSFFDDEKQAREMTHLEPGYRIKKGVNGQPDEIEILEISLCPGPGKI